MKSIQIVLQYNGVWTNDGKSFTDYKINSMSIEDSCTFDNFHAKICRNLNIDLMEKKVIIQYKVDDTYPPFMIDNDINFEFYKNIKRSELNFLKFPLCITTEKSHQKNVSDRMLENHALEVENYTTWEENDAHPSITELTIVECNQEQHDIDGYYQLVDVEVHNQCPIPCFENIKDLMGEIEKDVEEPINTEASSDRMYDESTFPSFENDPRLKIGDKFKNKAILKYYLAHYSLINHFNFKVKKSNARTYNIKCFDDECNWALTASAIANTNVFKVRRINENHSCSIQQRFQEHRQLSSKFIASMLGTKLKQTKTKFGPLQIQDDVNKKYGVEISYIKAWRSKQKLIEEIFGDPEQSYNDVPKYLHLLEKANPGSYTTLQINDDR